VARLSREAARARELRVARAWVEFANRDRSRARRLEAELGPDPPDAVADCEAGERWSIEVTELHRVTPSERASRAEGIVVWSAAELAEAIHRAVDHKSELRSKWPAALRRRYPRAVLLAVLDEHQRWEELPQFEALGAFDWVALVAWSDGIPRVVLSLRAQ